MRAAIGNLKNGASYVAFYETAEDDSVVLKAYFSPEADKIRIVLPQLRNMAQTRIDTERHFLEFTRNHHRAQKELKR